MNLRTIGVVISREYTTRVKKKSFLFTTFLVPVLFALVCCIPALIMLFNKDEGKIVAVVDRSGVVMQAFESTKEVQYADCSACCLDSLKAQFDDLPYDAILYISEIDADRNVSISSYSKKPMGMELSSNIERTVEDAIEDYRISQYNIKNLKTILEEVRPDISLTTYTIGEDGEDRISESGIYMGLSMFLGIIIFMFVSMFSGIVMQSVIEEKQSKVVEVILSSVDAIDLMFGKIIGVALVALTQFILWIVLTAAIVSVVFAVVGKDTLTSNPEVVSQLATQGGDMSAITGVDQAELVSSAMSQPDSLQTIMQTIANLDFPLILGSFLVFFIFGYLLYASMFAAIGSAVENAEDSNQLQLPLTVPLMLGYFLALYSWNAPDSALAVWGSMIPFTSPIVMLARVPFGVPSWQLWLSIAILVLTFMLMAWLSAKIYRAAILTAGKKATWKDIWKWLKQK